MPENRNAYNGNNSANRQRQSRGNAEYIGSHSRSGGTVQNAARTKNSDARKSSGVQHLTYSERRAAQNMSYGRASGTNERTGSRSSYAGQYRPVHSDGMQRSSAQRPAPQRTVSKQSVLKKLLKLGVLTALVLAVLYCAAAAFVLSGVNTEKVNTHWQDMPATAVSEVKCENSASVRTVLIIGADSDGGSGSRSDTLMLASVSGGKLRLCSILRDSYVEIPEHRASKINAALAYGGNELCMRTVESNFRVRVREYVRVDMDSLTAIIDGLGGVELTLTEKEAKAMNDHFGYPVASAGSKTYTGKYAVYYARIRKIDDDFHRVERQRSLLRAVADKCKHTSPLKLYALVGKVTPYITTNMSSNELATFGVKALAGFDKVEQMSVPVDGTWEYKSIGGQSCISMNIKKNAEAVQRFVLFKEEE